MTRGVVIQGIDVLAMNVMLYKSFGIERISVSEIIKAMPVHRAI